MPQYRIWSGCMHARFGIITNETILSPNQAGTRSANNFPIILEIPSIQRGYGVRYWRFARRLILLFDRFWIPASHPVIKQIGCRQPNLTYGLFQRSMVSLV